MSAVIEHTQNGVQMLGPITYPWIQGKLVQSH